MDKYQKVKVLGKGSFGSAILIKRKTDSALFVVKEVPLLRMGRKEREEARHECTVLQRLQHPNIVRYIEHFENRDNLYIVMEYCDGGDLGQKIKMTRGNMKESLILYYFSQVCLAMEYLHARHILHRDIKTMNVFLMKNGAVKLGDFGISTVLRNTMGMANTVCGTPYYFSPELCRNKPYNNKSDIWAMGVLLYECATGGRHPFDGTSMNQLMQRIVRGGYPPLPGIYSAEFRKMVEWCLQKDPARRPSIKQTLRLPIVRHALEELEENLMLATQCRVRLKDIIEFDTNAGGAAVSADKANEGKVRKPSENNLLRVVNPLVERTGGAGAGAVAIKPVNSKDKIINMSPGQAAALAMMKLQNRHREQELQQVQKERQQQLLLAQRKANNNINNNINNNNNNNNNNNVVVVPAAAVALVRPKPSANNYAYVINNNNNNNNKVGPVNKEHYSPYHQQIMKNFQRLQVKNEDKGGVVEKLKQSPLEVVLEQMVRNKLANTPTQQHPQKVVPKPEVVQANPRSNVNLHMPANNNNNINKNNANNVSNGVNMKREEVNGNNGVNAIGNANNNPYLAHLQRVDAIMARYGRRIDEKAKETIHAFMRRKQEEYMQRAKAENEKQNRRNELRQRELQKVLALQRQQASPAVVNNQAKNINNNNNNVNRKNVNNVVKVNKDSRENKNDHGDNNNRQVSRPNIAAAPARLASAGKADLANKQIVNVNKQNNNSSNINNNNEKKIVVQREHQLFGRDPRAMHAAAGAVAKMVPLAQRDAPTQIEALVKPKPTQLVIDKTRNENVTQVKEIVQIHKDHPWEQQVEQRRLKAAPSLPLHVPLQRPQQDDKCGNVLQEIKMENVRDVYARNRSAAVQNGFVAGVNKRNNNYTENNINNNKSNNENNKMEEDNSAGKDNESQTDKQNNALVRNNVEQKKIADVRWRQDFCKVNNAKLETNDNNSDEKVYSSNNNNNNNIKAATPLGKQENVNLPAKNVEDKLDDVNMRERVLQEYLRKRNAMADEHAKMEIPHSLVNPNVDRKAANFKELQKVRQGDEQTSHNDYNKRNNVPAASRNKEYNGLENNLIANKQKEHEEESEEGEDDDAKKEQTIKLFEVKKIVNAGKINRASKVNANPMEPLSKMHRVAQPLPQAQISKEQPKEQPIKPVVVLPRKIASASLVREVKQPMNHMKKQPQKSDIGNNKNEEDDTDKEDHNGTAAYKYNIISPRGLAGARLPPPKQQQQQQPSPQLSEEHKPLSARSSQPLLEEFIPIKEPEAVISHAQTPLRKFNTPPRVTRINSLPSTSPYSLMRMSPETRLSHSPMLEVQPLTSLLEAKSHKMETNIKNQNKLSQPSCSSTAVTESMSSTSAPETLSNEFVINDNIKNNRRLHAAGNAGSNSNGQETSAIKNTDNTKKKMCKVTEMHQVHNKRPQVNEEVSTIDKTELIDLPSPLRRHLSPREVPTPTLPVSPRVQDKSTLVSYDKNEDKISKKSDIIIPDVLERKHIAPSERNSVLSLNLLHQRQKNRNDLNRLTSNNNAMYATMSREMSLEAERKELSNERNAHKAKNSETNSIVPNVLESLRSLRVDEHQGGLARIVHTSSNQLALLKQRQRESKEKQEVLVQHYHPNDNSDKIKQKEKKTNLEETHELEELQYEKEESSSQEEILHSSNLHPITPARENKSGRTRNGVALYTNVKTKCHDIEDEKQMKNPSVGERVSKDYSHCTTSSHSSASSHLVSALPSPFASQHHNITSTHSDVSMSSVTNDGNDESSADNAVDGYEAMLQHLKELLQKRKVYHPSTKEEHNAIHKPKNVKTKRQLWSSQICTEGNSSEIKECEELQDESNNTHHKQEEKIACKHKLMTQELVATHIENDNCVSNETSETSLSVHDTLNSPPSLQFTRPRRKLSNQAVLPNAKQGLVTNANVQSYEHYSGKNSRNKSNTTSKYADECDEEDTELESSLENSHSDNDTADEDDEDDDEEEDDENEENDDDNFEDAEPLSAIPYTEMEMLSDDKDESSESK